MKTFETTKSVNRVIALILAFVMLLSLAFTHTAHADSYVDFSKLTYSTPVEYNLPSVTISATPAFTDVAKTYWGYSAIQEAYCRGWVNGTGNNKYSPESSVTYAQWFTMLTRVFFEDDLSNYSTGSTWYNQYMECAEAHGLLENTIIESTWRKSANQPIARYDMAMTVSNLLQNGYHKVVNRYYTIKSSYSDVNYNGLAKAAKANAYNYINAIGLCSDLGILNGVGNGKFSPNTNMTRAAAAAVLVRIPGAFENTSSDRWTNIWDTEEEALRNADNAKTNTLKNGQAITESNVAAMLATVGTGTTYNTNTCYSSNAVQAFSTQYNGCGTVAFRISDYIFGDLKWTGYCSDITKAHVGDILVTYKNNGTVSHIQILASTPTKLNNTYVEFTAYSGNLTNASDHGQGNITYASGSVNVTKKIMVITRYQNLDSSWTLYK